MPVNRSARATSRAVKRQLQPVETLNEHFSAGRIPSQQDFHDVIDMAAAASTLIGFEGPGAGLAHDEHQGLAVHVGDGVQISDQGLSVAVAPDGGLALNDAHQLIVQRRKIVSVDAIANLSEVDRAAIWQCLKSATPPTNAGARASATPHAPTAPLAPPSTRTAPALATEQCLPKPKQTLDVLRRHFASGHIPTEADYHDVITMASASYLLAGKKDGVGAGLTFNNNGQLMVHANSDKGVCADAQGVHLQLAPGGGLQFSDDAPRQLQVNIRQAFETLDNDARYAIYQLLAKTLIDKFGHEQSWEAETVKGSYFSSRAVAAISADGCTLAYRIRNEKDGIVVQVRRREHARAPWPEETAKIVVGSVDDEAGFYLAVSERGRWIAFSSTRRGSFGVYEFGKDLALRPIMCEGPDEARLLVIDVSESRNQLVGIEYLSHQGCKEDNIVTFTYNAEAKAEDERWKKEEPLRAGVYLSDGRLSADRQVIVTKDFYGDKFYVYDLSKRREIGSEVAVSKEKLIKFGAGKAKLDKNGSQLIVGTRTDDGVSHAFFYTLEDNQWKLNDFSLEGPKSAQTDKSQVTVCINDCGDIVIGQSTDDAQEIIVYYRVNHGWSEAHHLAAELEGPAKRYGARVEMSADGSTLLVMAEDRVYVYSRRPFDETMR